MRDINPIQHDYVRYYLLVDNQIVQIQEPDNWESSNKEFARSKQYHGFNVNISEAVQFSGETAKFLEDLYTTFGASTFITIIQEVKASITDEWEEIYSGVLDFSTASFGYEQFKCKINAGELEKLFTSRWRTELNVLNKTDLDGKELPLDDLETQTIELSDRGLQGVNTLDIGTEYSVDFRHTEDANFMVMGVLMTKLNETYYNLPQPFEVAREKFRSLSDHGDWVSVPDYANVDNLFFYQRQPETVYIEFQIDYEAEVSVGRIDTTFFLNLWQYDLEEEPVFEDFPFFVDESKKIRLFDKLLEANKTHKVVYHETLKLEIESLKAMTFMHGVIDDLANDYGTTAIIKRASITLIGDTAHGATKNDVFMPFPFFQRHIKLMGGGLLRSEYLEKCRYSLATGFMIRNVIKDEDSETPVSITFQKLYNSFDAVKPIGLALNRNTVTIEEREYFYQMFRSYDFGSEISDIDISYDKVVAYSEVNIGFETSNFSAEDALDEFNVRTVFTSPINNYRMRYNAVSDIQASSYVIEKLRRIQYQKKVDRTHTRRGDTTIFFIDLKDSSYIVREYNDDFEGSPKNLYKSNDAYNFRFSPMNRLRTQGAWINHGLSEFKDREFIFSSSTGNTSLITKPKGRIEMAENGNLPILEAGRPRFKAETATFKIRPMNLSKILNERIDGVQKMYGIFSFLYRGIERFGYLESYKPETYQVKLKLIQM